MEKRKTSLPSFHVILRQRKPEQEDVVERLLFLPSIDWSSAFV